VNTIVADIRYGVRRLRKSFWETAIAIMALGLGVGLTTTMFSIVYGVLVRGLPYPNGARIAIVYRNNADRGIRRQALPIQDFYDYRAQQQSFTALGGYSEGTVNLSDAERADRIDATWVTADVFSILGVQPMLGRGFSETETRPSGARVAVLSYRSWCDRYASRREIIGAPIRVDGLVYTVIGVMPEGFGFPASEGLWLPLQDDPAASVRGQGEYVTTIGALRPGVGRDAASADVATIARRLAAANPESDKGFDATAGTFTDWSIGPGPRRLLITMLGAVFCVLLIACANVMNLLSHRAAFRRRETALKSALGASRGVVLRGLLIEAALLSLGGVAFGVGIASVGVAVFDRATVNTGFPSFVHVELFVPVLLFAAAMGVISALMAGVLPALRASRVDIAEVLKDDSRGASSWRVGRLSRGLVILETAMSCMLLVLAGLMIESVTKIRSMDPGFATRDVFTAAMSFPAGADTARESSTLQRLRQDLGGLPNVRAVSISSGLPGASLGLAGVPIGIDRTTYAHPSDRPIVNTASVDLSFFVTLGIPVAEGRLFADADRAGAPPVAIVTQRFVKKFLGGRDPIGLRVDVGSPDADASAPAKLTTVTIVGVIPDIWGGDPENPHPSILFRPFAQAPSRDVALTVRTTGDPLAITRSAREILRSANPDIPLYMPESLATAIAEPLWFIRVFGTMFVIFGFIALFLAIVGLYGVMSMAVGRRTREMAIRIALGAQRGSITRLILGQGAVQLGVGITIGLVLAALIAPLLSAVLVGVEPRDPAVYAGVIAALFGSGTLACMRPVRRATRVDPMRVLGDG
jgi:predicted permease